MLGHDRLISQTQGATTSYYLADAQGSTRVLTDSSGAILNTYEYAAFGDLVAQTGTTPNAYLYTGQRYDAATEQYTLRAREYDPAVGRFLSRDTWAVDTWNPVELNRYVYAAGNPVTWSDPTGYMLTENALIELGTAEIPVATGQWVFKQFAIGAAVAFLGYHVGAALGAALIEAVEDAEIFGQTDTGSWKTHFNALRSPGVLILNLFAGGISGVATSILELDLHIEMREQLRKFNGAISPQEQQRILAAATTFKNSNKWKNFGVGFTSFLMANIVPVLSELDDTDEKAVIAATDDLFINVAIAVLNGAATSSDTLDQLIQPVTNLLPPSAKSFADEFLLGLFGGLENTAVILFEKIIKGPGE